MPRAALRRLLQFAWTALPQSYRDRLLPHLLLGISDSTQFRKGMPSLPGLMGNLKANGFTPQTIIDVGAFVGDWSRTARSVFPNAGVVMLDGNPENRESLARAARELNPAESLIALLGPENRAEVTFHVRSTGSSVLPDLTSFGSKPTSLPMLRLDDVIADRRCADPFFLKLDVQGFELEVLRGAPTTLKRSEVVILETSLLPFNEGAPIFSDVIAFMAESGFMAYDFCGQFRRETDHTLFQTDVVFARADSPLRAPKKFFLHEP